MIIHVNGEVHDVANDYSARQLVNLLGMQNDKIAMEVNQEIVPRSTYADFTFSDGDKIEIVRAIGGG